jgi:hypothetical protein
MSYDDVVEKWAPHLFRSVDSIPYEYFGLDSTPFLSPERRARAHGARKALTCAFLDREGDEVVQARFGDLARALIRGRDANVPRWSEVLAPREHQPRPGSREESPFAPRQEH